MYNGPSGWITFWSECENYRSINQDRWLESGGYMQPDATWPNIYYGGRKDYRGFDNGGRWLMSVHAHPTDGNPRHLLAFYHAEDGYWPRHPAGGPAWKSIGLVHSWDEGITCEFVLRLFAMRQLLTFELLFLNRDRLRPNHHFSHSTASGLASLLWRHRKPRRCLGQGLGPLDAGECLPPRAH